MPTIKEHFDRIVAGLSHVNVVELGAHRGHDTVDLVRRIGRRGYTYTAFEGGKPQFERLKTTIQQHRACVTPVHKAVAAVTGKCSWWPSLGSHYSGSSSIREPTGHREIWPQCHFGAPEEVECTTLDDYFGDKIPTPVHFVWADIQGAEGDAIRGAPRFFAQTHYLFAEVWSAPAYAGSVLRSEMVPLLCETTGCEWVEDADYGDVLYRNASLAPTGV